ncbi:MAG: hypothetical protein RAP03_09005 [Candidatus Electryonea clarkiae]|nr:hypothetical protein [Candidatus Electryonea clarkiae]
MKFSVDGLDDIQKKLKELQKKANALDGENQLPISDLLTVKFLKENSNFESVDEMFEQSGFTIETTKHFENIPDDEWEDFIWKNTCFKSWQEMLDKASEEWIANQLGL